MLHAAFRRVAAVLAVAVLPATATAAEREYFIAIEETDWDYAPSGRDAMMGMAFHGDQRIFVTRGANRIGRTYRKALYREYTDASFRTAKPRPEAWAHLGLLGPVIRAEVGDTVTVVLRNKASRPYSLHPHGMRYRKDSEGSPYADGTTGTDKADDGVPPGGTHTYRWEVPERAGPGPNDPSAIAWLYHSHVDETADVNAGLVGVILVTAKGKARADASPLDVDREFVTLYAIMDENKSPYLAANVRRFTKLKAPPKKDEEFEESNLKHAINGRLFANLDGFTMKRCERVRWYVVALGSEQDIHTPHWHGNTGLMDGKRVDVVDLLPASTRIVDMRPDAAGIWMFHCHVHDHMDAGMSVLYTVEGGEVGDCP